MSASEHKYGLEIVPNAAALRGRRTQLGDRVWNDELQAIQVAVMGGWELETTMVNRLSGYTFCLTGKMWTTREKVESHIQAAGGRVSRSMTQNAILVQGDVAGAKTSGTKSKKQLTAERNGQKVITHNDLRASIEGLVSLADLIGMSPKKTKRTPAEPIDRDKQNRTVKQVFDDIEAIAFGK